MKLSDNDYEIMNIVWDEGEVTALEIASRLAEKKGWKKPTVYTLIDRLIKKGAIERSEPDYVCKALINKDEVRTSETAGLLEKLYNGSAKLLVSGFIKEKQLSAKELEELRKLIDESIDKNDRGE
ncbi:MAG: BlaI/MecI/CopY family transcriptional regulator [Oscillospiraceae bacterium]